jgi:hypothetical protein
MDQTRKKPGKENGQNILVPDLGSCNSNVSFCADDLTQTLSCVQFFSMKPVYINLLGALLVNALVIVICYYAAQPDPKGIGFFFFVSIYACLQCIVGVVMLMRRFSVYKFLYAVSLVGNAIFLYAIATSGESWSQGFNELLLVILLGVGVFLTMLFRFIVVLRKSDGVTS